MKRMLTMLLMAVTVLVWADVPTPSRLAVTLNANGGRVSRTAINYSDMRSALNLPTPTRSGYVFKYWTTECNVPPDDLWILRMLQPVVRKQAVAVVCRHDPRPDASAYGRIQSVSANASCVGDSDFLVALPIKGNVKELIHCAQLSNVACALARETAINYPYRGVFAEDFDLGR